MVPDEAPAALSQADIAEFGKPADLSPGAHLAADPDAQRDYLGLPRGMSMRDGEQYLRLGASRAVGQEANFFLQGIGFRARRTGNGQNGAGVGE